MVYIIIWEDLKDLGVDQPTHDLMVIKAVAKAMCLLRSLNTQTQMPKVM